MKPKREPEVVLVRLSHRIMRDVRTTTHCCLVARAFNAKTIYVLGEKEESLEGTLSTMNETFGSQTKIIFEKQKPVALLKELQQQGFCVVHLTMYGMPLEEKLVKLQQQNKMAIVVGSEKVPREVYEQANYNIAVGSQPHSEVAALGITLYAIHDGTFPTLIGGKKKIIPQEKGKRVVNPNI